jgi:ribonuclease HII
MEEKKIKAFFIKDNEDGKYIEIGIDEAGRGPMFGRVYSAAVILPKDAALFDHTLMKDSKKFHSVKKIQAAAAYIKANAIAWHVAYADEKTIDAINIRNATHKAMHEAAQAVIAHTLAKEAAEENNFHLLVDGCDFTPLIADNVAVTHTCIEGGDNLYAAIAAASILAKTERDKYIEEMCAQNPELITKYDLLKNKGYGTKKHLDGIRAHGITAFHRRSFGMCKMFA